MKNNDEITLFPNPEKKYLTVTFPEVLPSQGIIEVRNATGQVVESIIHPIDVPYLNVNAEHLAPGIYFLEWKTYTSRIVNKFIITN